MAWSTVTDCSSMEQRTTAQLSVLRNNTSVKPSAVTRAFHLKSSTNPPWDLLETHENTQEALKWHFLCFHNMSHPDILLLEICVGQWRCWGGSGQTRSLILIRPDSSGLYPCCLYLAHWEIHRYLFSPAFSVQNCWRRARDGSDCC